MDHIVYLDHQAKELENLLSGQKTMIIRGAMGRKLPHGRVDVGDTLYFIRNNSEGLIRAKALVSDVHHSEKLTTESSHAMVDKNKDKLLLDTRLLKRFSGKRYLVLISVSRLTPLEPFGIDRSDYKTMDDWLPVNDIASVHLKVNTL